jgi:flagellar motility protein MotE (MotC chaperone)
MSKSVKLLPVLIAVAAGAVVLRGAGLVGEALAAGAEGAETAAAATTEAAAAPAEGPATGTEAANANPASADDACVPAPDYAGETGLSQYEIQVLRTLQDRRQIIDQRERDLDTREQVVVAAESDLDARVAELRELEEGIRGLLVQVDEQRETRLAALVKVYETMKPKDAAEIFEALDDAVMMDVASRMKNAALAAILGELSPPRARAVTGMLAARAAVPESADALRAGAG